MDDELRRLERALAATGDPETRLALAGHLERIGRRDDALQALWPGRENAEVQRAVARFPIAAAIGFPGGNSTDTAPLRDRPRVLWRHQHARAVRFGRIFFSPSPLGVVCCVDSRRLVVLDPDDGQIRWQRPLAISVPSDRPRFEEELLVVPDAHEEVLIDLWSGTPRSRRPFLRECPPQQDVMGPTDSLAGSSDVEVIWRTQSGSGELIARDRGNGSESVLATDVYEVNGVALARDVVFSSVWQLPARSTLSAHERGRLLWTLEERDLSTTLTALAPLAGRLYALGLDGSVSCLGR